MFDAYVCVLTTDNCGVSWCIFRLAPSSSADVTPTDGGLAPMTSDFGAVAQPAAAAADNAAMDVGSGEALPTQDDVVRKTDRITKRLQELFLAAQEGNSAWYVFERNCWTVLY